MDVSKSAIFGVDVSSTMLITAVLLLPLVYRILMLFGRRIKLHPRQAWRSNEANAPPRPPPGSSGLPVLGETLQFLRCMRRNKLNEFINERARRHGSTVFRTSLFGRSTVVMHGQEANRFLFGNDGRLVGPYWPPTLVKLLGDSSFVATGDPAHHRRLRRLFMAGIGSDALSRTGAVARADALMERHLALHWAGRPAGVLYTMVRSLTLDVGGTLLAGLDRIRNTHSSTAVARLFHTLSAGLISLPLYLPFTAYYRAHVARTRLHQLLGQMVHQRQAGQSADDDARLRPDFVSSLLAFKDENGRAFTTKEIVDILLSLLFASQDTINSPIVFTCKYLWQHPEYLREVLKEQLAISQSKRYGEQLTWNDLNKMRYTWNAIQETMRLHPPAFGVFYIALQDFEYKGFQIPCGWVIFLSITRCHMDESYFSNPTSFQPSRFDGSNIKPYTFIPFGGGLHKCAGIDFARMVMLLFFHHLVRKFKLIFVNPFEDISYATSPYPINGFSIKLAEQNLPQNMP